MRFLFYILVYLCFGINNTNADDILKDDKIYFFTYQKCPYCQQANSYIKQNCTNLNIVEVDIHKPGGMYLLKECAKKFSLKNNIGTPLFCFKDRYIMGWSEDNQKEFESLCKKSH